MTRRTSGPVEHVVVVGAGLSGLAAALHLAGRGVRVTVLEREALPGGRAGRLDRGGFRFDTGPTVLTMPEVLADTLAAVDERIGDRLDLAPVRPAYRTEFADGTGLDVHAEADAMADAVAGFAGPDAAREYLRLRRWLTTLYRTEFDTFVASNVDSPLSLVTPALGRLAAMGGFRRLDPAVRRFVTDERLRRVFTFQSLYAGRSPRQALALYAVIAYMDTVAGVYFPRGGMRAVPDALAAAAERAGVRFHYATTVTGLTRRAGRVAAVETADGTRVACDAVVLSAELGTCYRLLGHTPRRPVRHRPAPSAVVVHLGTRTRWPAVHHHTLLFGGAWERTFREITREGVPMRDPSLLVSRPTATDPALAPDGGDTLYVLAPVPNLDRCPLDWDRDGPRYAQGIERLVERRLLPGLADGVEVRAVYTPADWARQDMMAGTPFSLAHTAAQTGPFRPRNLPRGEPNVVLAGCGTVPGVGVPTALISGRLAADRVTGPVHRRQSVATGAAA